MILKRNLHKTKLILGLMERLLIFLTTSAISRVTQQFMIFLEKADRICHQNLGCCLCLVHLANICTLPVKFFDPSSPLSFKTSFHDNLKEDITMTLPPLSFQRWLAA